MRGRSERKEPFNSGGHLKDRSGFLVAPLGFCGSLPGTATPSGSKRVEKERE